ncbi:MAG: hypothetical protein JRJ34_03430 [Deltaproteobacteria bacterium]|nr:hypothetical protein [Deltaproteobacteria bacterium]
MVAVDETPVLGFDPGIDTFVELFEQPRLDGKVVFKAFCRVRREFGVQFCRVPDLEVGPTFQLQNKDNDHHRNPARNPVTKGLERMLCCAE